MIADAPPRTGEITQASDGVDRTVASPEPLVTVVIVTYNHRPYIAEALESVLAQSTSFPVEIIVSEDASTDGTRELVLDYQRRHSARIRLLLSERNVRSNEVVARGLRVARGRYVALLDGDDWWCDPCKLQRQADFLDENPGCSAMFQNAIVAIGNEVTDRRWTPPTAAHRWTLDRLLEGNPFATCAGMLRAACVREVPDWYADFFPITDWPLYVLCARSGELAFEDEATGVYRLHPASEFSSQTASARHLAIQTFYHRLARVGDSELAAAAHGGCSRYFFDWAKDYLAEGNLPLARDCFRRSLVGGGVGRTVAPWDVARLGTRLAWAWVARS